MQKKSNSLNKLKEISLKRNLFKIFNNLVVLKELSASLPSLRNEVPVEDTFSNPSPNVRTNQTNSANGTKYASNFQDMFKAFLEIK